MYTDDMITGKACVCGKAVFCRGLCQSCYGRHRYLARKVDGLSSYKQLNAKQKEKICEKQRRRFGFWPGLTRQLRELQQGRCAVCRVELDLEHKKSGTGEQADHCHHSMRPRGLVCGTCNKKIGHLEKGRSSMVGEELDQVKNYLADPPAFKIKRPLPPPVRRKAQ